MIVLIVIVIVVMISMSHLTTARSISSDFFAEASVASSEHRSMSTLEHFDQGLKIPPLPVTALLLNRL